MEIHVVPHLPLEIIVEPKRKAARGKIRNGSIEIAVPRHWSKDLKSTICQELYGKVKTRFEDDYKIVHGTTNNLITLTCSHELKDFILKINRETFNIPSIEVCIGRSRYSTLAYMDIDKKIMTVSRYCLYRVPEKALRYLIVHELAHLKVPNHSPRFWRLVKQFVPDVLEQKQIIEAFHQVRVYEADLPKNLVNNRDH